MDKILFNKKKTIMVIVLFLIAVLSFFVISKKAGAPETYKHQIESLDEKKDTVLQLVAASTAVSTAITVLPDDIGNPTAEKLADLSSYFLIVLTVIYFEKYMMTVFGWLIFRWVIPVICMMVIGYLFTEFHPLKIIARKLLMFSIAVVLVVPMSVTVADIIQDTYKESVDNLLKDAETITVEIEEKAEDEEDEGVIAEWWSGVKDNVSTFTSGITAKVEDAKNALNRFLEALAIMIITCCLIPIAVMVFLIWLVKIIFGLNFDMKATLRSVKKK